MNDSNNVHCMKCHRFSSKEFQWSGELAITRFLHARRVFLLVALRINIYYSTSTIWYSPIDEHFKENFPMWYLVPFPNISTKLLRWYTQKKTLMHFPSISVSVGFPGKTHWLLDKQLKVLFALKATCLITLTLKLGIWYAELLCISKNCKCFMWGPLFQMHSV